MPLFEMASTSGPECAEGPVSFLRDIQLMMYGLGDCSQPLKETAELIEEIVLRQMVCVINKARAVGQMRGQDSLAPDDILFLMRHDQVGLKRLIDYLGVKDDRQMLNKAVKAVPDDPEAVYFADGTNPAVTWQKSRKLYCLEFLKSIGIEETDLENTEDPVKQERVARANQTSLNISAFAYENFQSARQASFGAAEVTPARFIRWLKQKGRVGVELKPSMLEILVYLAKETVAKIIDKVLTLREEMKVPRMVEPPPVCVGEVQEVVRLYFQLQSVPFSVFSRDILNYTETRLIAI